MSNPDELWQLYDEQGNLMVDKGATPENVLTKGLLHGASHVWIWRVVDGKTQILLQKRASSKLTWPNYYDISAAGHIDLGETPLIAALREAKEEINLDIKPEDLKFAGSRGGRIAVPDSELIENEFCFIYTLRLDDETNFSLNDGEVDSLVWKDIETMKTEIQNGNGDEKYVPHGSTYFSILFDAMVKVTKE
ncbi:NUDIX domain-containing protein [Candidatus Saccharibacteria bacterium]|nr:NUDIX domain-containing protein [Candidatus Saccharibacteria bacterium]